jgi:hypothetical protein
MSDITDIPTPPVDTPAPPDASDVPKSADKPDTGKDWQAEAEKWKSFARKHEDSAKANADKAKRFDEFEESQKTEQQKLADAAAAAQEVAKTASIELALMKAAVKHGLSEGDLELLGTHGTPDEIDQRAEKLAGRLKVAGEAKPKPDFGGGDRGGDVTATTFDAQIDEALKARDFTRVISLREQKAAAAKPKP